MFLSKIFGIFKKKKDTSSEVPTASSSPSGAVVPPSTGAVGAAVGLSQPGQQPEPSPIQVAEAPQDPFSLPAAPSTDDSSLSSPSVPPASDTPSTEPSASNDTVPSYDNNPTPVDSGIGTDTSADSLNPLPDISVPPETPPETPSPEAPVPPPADPAPADDSQNIAV